MTCAGLAVLVWWKRSNRLLVQLTKDPSAKFDFPVEYMFKNVPKELYGSKDPISLTLHEMDRFGIKIGVIGAGGEISTKALKDHPDRFVPMGSVDPNRGIGRHP